MTTIFWELAALKSQILQEKKEYYKLKKLRLGVVKMVNNLFISCDMCGTVINLRAQIGFYDIPFNIHCPECMTSINGKLLCTEGSSNLEINNAHVTDKYDSDFYSFELSAEFLTRKMIKKNMSVENIEISPFIKNFEFYGDMEQATNATKKAMFFADFKNSSNWKIIKSNFELFWNGQTEMVIKRMKNEVKRNRYTAIPSVLNELDAYMTLHQLFITTTGISEVVKPDSIKKYIDISNSMFNKKKENYQKVIDFTNQKKGEFNSIEKKGFKLIDNFSKIYEQLIPIVALRNYNEIENIDKTEYGIMTANFEELSDFYAKSFEWILDNIDLIVILNNIYVRNNYNICSNNRTLQDMNKESSKYRKLNYLNGTELFGTEVSSLETVIRNSIQHYDSEINYTTQEIIFSNNHKGKLKETSLYLMEFANLCLENFNAIMYLLEIVYNLRKINYISQGLKPSIALGRSKDKKEETNKKTGRNEMCPCGSNKKYKRCCGL